MQYVEVIVQYVEVLVQYVEVLVPELNKYYADVLAAKYLMFALCVMSMNGLSLVLYFSSL